jgi:hypothetical protein
MAGCKLAIREVHRQPFKASHIEIIDKLYDSHGVQYDQSLIYFQ